MLQNSINNLPSVGFDGTDRFVLPNFPFDSSNTGFVVGKNNPVASLVNCAFIAGNNYNFDFYPNKMQIKIGLIYVGNYPSDSLSLLTLVREPTSAKAFRNGLLSGPSNNSSLGPMTLSNLYIGNRNDLLAPLNGKISEIIIFNKALPDSSRVLVEHYLQSKYTPELFLGNDTNFVSTLCPNYLSVSPAFQRFIWSTVDTTISIFLNTTVFD